MRISYKLGEEHVFVDDEFKDLTIFCYDCNRKNFVTLYNMPFSSRPQYFHYKIPCAYCGKETVLSVIKNNDITKYIITPLIFAEIHNIANFESNIIIKKEDKVENEC